MWPFGKKKVDLDALGLALLQHASEYQMPTVEGTYAYLEKSGQLQYRDEDTEKRILNTAASVVVVELVLFQMLQEAGPRAAMAKHDILDHFYGYVQKLSDMSFAGQHLRIEEGKALTMRLIHQGISDYPEQSSDPHQENLTYDMLRAVIRLHVQWASSNGDRVAVPDALNDTSLLSQAAEGLARARRWIHSSLGKEIKQVLA